jgi:hypothetical protein
MTHVFLVSDVPMRVADQAGQACGVAAPRHVAVSVTDRDPPYMTARSDTQRARVRAHCRSREQLLDPRIPLHVEPEKPIRDRIWLHLRHSFCLNPGLNTGPELGLSLFPNHCRLIPNLARSLLIENSRNTATVGYVTRISLCVTCRDPVVTITTDGVNLPVVAYGRQVSYDANCALKQWAVLWLGGRQLIRKHIEPRLGGAPIGRLSTRMIRQWRATLLANGVSVSVAAKAYRLVRAILTTAVEDDKILPRNPCRIRGAGTEYAAERPVLTVAQVFELAERVGRRPVGNIAKSQVATCFASAATARCVHR